MIKIKNQNRSQEQYLREKSVESISKEEFNELPNSAIIVVSKMTGDLFIYDSRYQAKNNLELQNGNKFNYFKRSENTLEEIERCQSKIRRTA